MKQAWCAGVLSTLLTGASLVGGCDRGKAEAVSCRTKVTPQESGNIDGAIAKWEEASNLDPDNHRIHYRLVQAYRKKKDWEKVVTTAVKAQRADEKLNSKKTFAVYYFEQGLALARIAATGKGKWLDARQPLETAIQVDPNLSQAYFELAEVLLRLEDEKGAIEYYNKAIERDPKNTDFYGPLADLYVNLNFATHAEEFSKKGSPSQKMATSD